MGTNLFVEGSPSPVVLSVALPNDVHSFRDIGAVSLALADVDKTLHQTWPKLWPSFDQRRHRDVWVLHFRVDSPPSFEILTDPAWLSVFLLVLTQYKQGKESIGEILADGSRLFAGIKGLSEREFQLLHIAVKLALERCAELGEAERKKLARRFHRVRERLLGRTEEVPKIQVKDIDNQHRPW